MRDNIAWNSMNELLLSLSLSHNEKSEEASAKSKFKWDLE